MDRSINIGRGNDCALTGSSSSSTMARVVAVRDDDCGWAVATRDAAAGWAVEVDRVCLGVPVFCLGSVRLHLPIFRFQGWLSSWQSRGRKIIDHRSSFSMLSLLKPLL